MSHPPPSPGAPSLEAGAGHDPAAPTVVIEPRRGVGHLGSELWRHRELFLFLAWRDLLVRYKQTALGIAWAGVRPAVAMVIFSFVFGRIAGLPAEGGAPYALFVLAGLLPWQLVTSGASDAGNSLVVQANLISKVYFPRLLVPASALSVSLADALVSFALLGTLVAYHGIRPGPQLVALPVVVLLATAVALGAGLWLSALTVRWRDVRVIVPFLVQISLYASPVAYGSSLVPERWRPLYELNPLVGLIDGFRWALLSGTGFPGRSLAFAAAVAVLLVTTGLAHFRRTERSFADVI